MIGRVKDMVASALAALKARPGALGLIFAAVTVAAAVLIFWFLVFSGMNEPVQFVYSSF